uniref:Uncharacterized protein n=1 Tax=Cacopsylla melanoneura TaxID=428564 RepID=A0A8D9FHG2_9HEMI
MQKNDTDCRPLVNRRKAALYSTPRYIIVPQDDTNEIPTVVDQLLEYNRKLVAMEKAEQSSSSQAQNLPRLRRRPKQEVQDDKPLLKRASAGKDSVGSKSPVPNEKGPKRSLRSNAGQDVAPKVKLRSSLKNEDTCKKLSPGKKILKKGKGVTSAKKGNHSVAEESVLRNGKRKRKAKSPVFPEKDTKKKMKKVIDDSNSSSSTPSDVNFLNDEELEDENSVIENVKVKRLSLDDVTSINSKSEFEEKDSEDNVKKDSETLSKVSNQMKIKNRKKKSRSIEKTGGNIWAVDSNGSELVISDTTPNTSRRSSFNSISSENNSNNLDLKIEHPPATSSTNNQQDQDTKPINTKTDNINDCPPIVKTQLVVPFLINNKPVLKVGNAIKKIVDDTTTDYTDSDNLVIDTDDEESALFKPKAHSENKPCNNTTVIDIDETEQKSVSTNESEDKTNLVNHNDSMELELSNETECKPKCDDTKPKNTTEAQEHCDIKQIDKEVTDSENSDGLLVKNMPASSAAISTNVADSAPSISNFESNISILSNSDSSTSISTSVSSYSVSSSAPSSSVSNSASNTSLPDVINTFVNDDDDDSIIEDSRPKKLSLSLPSKTTEETSAEESVTEVHNEEKLENIDNSLQSEKDEGDLSINMGSCIQNDKSDESTPSEKVNEISNVFEEEKEEDKSLEKEDVIENKTVDESDNVLKENKSEPLILPPLTEEDNECKAEEIEKIDDVKKEEEIIENDKDRLICVVNNLVDQNQSDKVLKEDNSKKPIRPPSTLTITKDNTERKAKETKTNEPFLNPETGLLENVNDWEKKKEEIHDETTRPVGALLNVAVDNKIEKVQGNFISPDSISTKGDENISLYEDTEMVDAETKSSEEKELEINESISSEFTSLKDETMLPDNELEEIVEQKFGSLEVSATTDKKTETANVVPSTPTEDHVELKNIVKGILLEESDALRELEDQGSNLIEIKRKVDFLKNLKLHSSNPSLGQGLEKNAKICFGAKDASSEKDENYTGTLKVTLTRKRDGEKKKCDTDTKEEETTLEYKICPKRIHKVNYKNLPLTLMYSFGSECPQSPPISFYKPNNHYKQDYSFRVLTYVGPVEKDDVTPSTSGQDSSANGSASTQAEADSEKPTRKKIVIPEKSSSFQIHPKRFCDDVCMYCRTKFGSLDTPCHIAQLKSIELQNQVIKSGK